jgi:hypothetical protein
MAFPWNSLEPVDESFFAAAPVRHTLNVEVARPADQVWADLVRDGTLDWCRGLRADWTSSRPFGVGTTRTVKVLGGAVMIVRERYFLWEEGRRKSFYVYEATAPAFKRFAEDYVIEPTSESSCRFTWTIANEPSAIGKPLAFVDRLISRRLFADTRKHFS